MIDNIILYVLFVAVIILFINIEKLMNAINSHNSAIDNLNKRLIKLQSDYYGETDDK